MPLLLASEFPDVFDKAKPYFPAKRTGLVTIINTASIGEGFELNPATEINPFKNSGYDVELLDLMSQGGVKEQLDKSDIVYVAGGNTFYLLAEMKKSNFSQVLKERMNDDFLYIGSSAGSIVMSSDIDFISPMDDPEKGNLDNTIGLNMIPFSFLPHIGHETMGKAAEEIKSIYTGKPPLYCFQDHQAVYINGNRTKIL